MFGQFGALMKLLGNKDKIAAEVAKLQATIAAIRAEASAGGVVRVTVNGKMEVLTCQLGEAALNHADRAVLEGLILAATNQALAGAREQLAAETQKMATELGIPPEMLGGLGGGIPGLG